MKEIMRLEQSAWFRGKRSFTLIEDGILRVSFEQAKNRESFSVNLACLDPEPFHERKVAFFSLCYTVFLTICAFFLAVAPPLFGLPREVCLPFLVPSGILLLISLLGWRVYLRQTYDIWGFQNPFGGQGIVLLTNRPDKTRFETFIERLKVEIVEQRKRLMATTRSLPDQIKELSELKDKGFLTEEEFSKAKQNMIDSARTPSKIGF